MKKDRDIQTNKKTLICRKYMAVLTLQVRELMALIFQSHHPRIDKPWLNNSGLPLPNSDRFLLIELVPPRPIKEPQGLSWFINADLTFLLLVIMAAA